MEQMEVLQKESLEQIQTSKSLAQLNDLRVQLLGKKGSIQGLMKHMKDLPNDQKPQFGAKVNELKQIVAAAIEEKKEALEKEALQAKIESEKIDITLPGRVPVLGNMHPLNMVRHELEDLFLGLGYQIIEGDDIVDDLYCFERANIPKDHPIFNLGKPEP